MSIDVCTTFPIFVIEQKLLISMSSDLVFSCEKACSVNALPPSFIKVFSWSSIDLPLKKLKYVYSCDFIKGTNIAASMYFCM